MNTQTVSVDNLKDQTKIVAFVQFSKSFQKMDDPTTKWVILNFKGATAEILRAGHSSVSLIDHLHVGDTLLKIHKFPDTLKKFTHVTRGLQAELKKRGFLAFEVIPLPKAVPTTKAEKHIEAVKEANHFIQQVKESEETRDQATDAIKDMMDQARIGKPSAKTVQTYVTSIVSSTSTEAMSAIASLKSSDQTYAHCIDAGAIFFNAYYEIKKRKKEPSIFKEPRMALLGAFMHDFGKAKVPKDVLESKVRFERESKEMQLLQSHPIFGAELLTSMGMPDYIVNMSKFHHVKMQSDLNSSYPAGTSYDKVLMETRLVSIVDVYQALIGKRSYKKSWPPAAAIRYIDALSGVEFDPKVWDDFLNAMGQYPKGSLVELSDGSWAFVMSVPEKDLERPQVVVIRDKAGKDVQNFALIDLEDVQELSIAKDLDHYELLGDKALDYFMRINIS